MTPLRFAFLAALVPAAAGLALAHDPLSPAKNPLPPTMVEDVKTPAPPRPAKEPRVQEESLDRGAVESLVVTDKTTVREVGSGFLAGLGVSEVLYDLPGDGRIWAAADRYKASFGVEGATYIPFFGSLAPRNHPVRFAVRSVRAGASVLAFDPAAEPVRQGDRIVFDRGTFSEVYDLSLGSIEQSFVFEHLPERGELVIELDVASDMARSADPAGLVFASESGSVRYTNAIAIDGRGVRSDAPTAWSGEGVSIRVTAADLERASFPLVVDPVVSTFNVENDTTNDHFSPDVAYDATYNRWFAPYERGFSADDHDIYSRRLSLTGDLLSTQFIDVTDVHWAEPSVANNSLANVWLTVAAVGDPAGGARIIRGRTIDAAVAGGGSGQFTISGSETGDKTDPVVGGDPSSIAPTYFCVAWRRVVSSTDTDIHARLVAPDPMLFGGVILLSNSLGTRDGTPAISKTNGVEPLSLQIWNIVFTRSDDLFDSDLYGARIRWDGLVTSTPFAIDTSSAHTIAPSVSTSLEALTREYLVAYTVSPIGGDPDIHAKLMQGTSTLDTINLTAASDAPVSERQINSCTDSDGHSFVVLNAETFNGSTTDYDVYASTFVALGGKLLKAEGHVPLATTAFREDQPRIACPEASGESFALDRPAFAIWHQLTTTGLIQAATYDLGSFTSVCTPGSGGILACPCGNAPSGPDRGCDNSVGTGGATLGAAGSIDADTVVLTAQDMLPTALCIFGQGSSFLSTGTAFGDGLRCASGTLLRLATKAASGGTASFPVGADPSIKERASQLGFPIASGDRRFYYTYYRDPASFGCTATFNSTNTVMVQW